MKQSELTEYFAGVFVKCVKNCLCKGTNDADVEVWIGKEMKIRQRKKYPQSLNVRRRWCLEAGDQCPLQSTCNLQYNTNLTVQPKYCCCAHTQLAILTTLPDSRSQNTDQVC